MTTVGASDVPLTSYLTASLRIWLRSPLLRMLIAVIVFMVATCGLQFTTGRHGWDDALGFLNLWVVAAGPLFVALTVGYPRAHRPDRSQRPVSSCATSVRDTDWSGGRSSR